MQVNNIISNGTGACLIVLADLGAGLYLAELSATGKIYGVRIPKTMFIIDSEYFTVIY